MTRFCSLLVAIGLWVCGTPPLHASYTPVRATTAVLRQSGRTAATQTSLHQVRSAKRLSQHQHSRVLLIWYQCVLPGLFDVSIVLMYQSDVSCSGGRDGCVLLWDLRTPTQWKPEQQRMCLVPALKLQVRHMCI